MNPVNSVQREAQPILYSFRRCPYAMRARLALWASGQSYELREILLRDKPADMLQASPKGTVPVLVLPSGQVLDESLDIMLWALNQHDPLGWLAPSNGPLAAAIMWVHQCDESFKRQLDAYKYPNRNLGNFGNAVGPKESAGAVDAAINTAIIARDEATQFLSQLNQQLTGQAGLFSSSFGFTDAAIAPFVRQFAAVQPHWFASQLWPGLQQWLTGFCESDAFASLMQKQPVWKQNEPAGSFLVQNRIL